MGLSAVQLDCELRSFEERPRVGPIGDLATRVLAQSDLSLQRRAIALKGRVARPQEVAPGDDLLPKVQSWWDAHPTLQKATFNIQDVLKDLRAPEQFWQVLTQDDALRSQFCEWVFLLNLPIEPWVYFPHQADQLRQVGLAARLGRFGGSGLKVTEEDGELDLKLCVESERVSILDHTRVDDIFKDFAAKGHAFGQFEVLEGVVRNWNPERHSFRGADGTEHVIQDWKKWPVFEKISKEELLQRFDVTPGEEGQWLLAVKSTVGHERMDFNDLHGYIELAIPEGDRYKMIPLGKFTRHLPKTFWDTIALLARTDPATLAYPDPNEFIFPSRQQAHRGFWVDPVRTGDALDKLLQRYYGGESRFQLFGDNCMQWADAFARECGAEPLSPEAPLTDIRPENPILRFVFWVGRRLPEGRMRRIWLRFVMTLLGGHRCHQGESVCGHSIMETGRLAMPAHYHRNILQGDAPGRVTVGHRRIPLPVQGAATAELATPPAQAAGRPLLPHIAPLD